MKSFTVTARFMLFRYCKQKDGALCFGLVTELSLNREFRISPDKPVKTNCYELYGLLRTKPVPVKSVGVLCLKVLDKTGLFVYKCAQC